jgi:quercetin dioxygenase-like cupin family protein
VSRAAALPTLLAEDGRVRVTRFDFAPGAETGWHVHGHDYVIVAVTECRMRLEEPGGGRREATVPAGGADSRRAGVEHNVINAGEGPMAFVEVEFKEPPR